MSSPMRDTGPDGIAHSLTYQPALDGIRALAVGLVVAFHFGLRGFQGGFLGVDVFFGLSGFLITTLLLREHAATGTIKLRAFWLRRFRRLLPGLLVMVTVSIAISWLVFPPSYFPSLGRDALAAIFYFTNWHLIGIRASYFNASIAPTIVTHTWSLSIEEQFYWVWPLVMLAVLRIRQSGVVLISVLGATASAVVMAVLVGERSFARLYFGTDTHVQGLLLGAAAAYLVRYLDERHANVPRPLQRVATPIGTVGLIGILFIAANVDGSSPFLFNGGFFLFGLCVAGLIVSLQVNPDSMVARGFGLRPLAYIGRISYSIYLWHYPVFTLITHYRTGVDGYVLFGLRLCITVALSLVSYYYVELPIRRREFSVQWRSVLPRCAVVAVVAVGTWFVGTEASRVPGYPVIPPPHPGPTVNALTIGDSGIMTFSWATLAQRAGAGVEDYSDAAYGCGLVGGTYPIFKGTRTVQNPDCRMQRDGNWPLRKTWSEDIAKRRPDVVVVAAGRWEAHNQKIFRNIFSIDDASFRRMITKSLDIIRVASDSAGSSMILVTTPCAHSGETAWGKFYVADTAPRIDAYNSLIRRYAATYKLQIYDLGGSACPGGNFSYFIDKYMVRAPDGFHYTNGAGPVLGQDYWNFVRSVGTTSRVFHERQAAQR